MRKTLNSELNRLSIDDFKKAPKIPLIIILDNIRSLNNIGSVFRTADAFLVQEIFLCGITAKPPHRDIQKTALGATESINWRYFKKIEDAIKVAKKDEFKVIGIEQTDTSVSLDNFTINQQEKIAVIFGNEVKGISESAIDQLDECIEIQQYGTKHSLNISVCAGIIIWDLFNKLKSFK